MLRRPQDQRKIRVCSCVSILLSPLVVLCLPNAIQAQEPPIRSETIRPQAFGGTHEFGLWSGYSPHAGAVVGYVENFTYGVSALRYSYRLRQRSWWSIRYAPELTILSVLHENARSPTNPQAPVTHYGAGFSPEAFQLVFLPARRVQPFLSHAGGILYYNGRVLSPGGSQLMFTVDLGAGVNLFTTRGNAIVAGFRYQHLSNANISHHNPGADAQTFYLGFSHFLTHRAR